MCIRDRYDFGPVKVLSEHKNLINRSIMKNTLMNPARVRRIIDVLNMFNLEIIHIPGVQNSMADLLSRGPEFEKINKISVQVEEVTCIQDDRFIKAQEEDHEIGGIKAALTKTPFDEKYTEQETKMFIRTTRRFTINAHDAVCYRKHNNGKLLLLPAKPKSMQEKKYSKRRTKDCSQETILVKLGHPQDSVIWYTGKAYKRQPRNM